MKPPMTRRDLLQFGSAAALSTAIGPSVAESTASNSLSVSASHSASEICFLSATEMAKLVRRKKLSAREIMEAHLRQIGRVNPKVNSLVTMVDGDQLLALAHAADERLVKSGPVGPLHGLPVAVKDLHDTKGIRTTYGSPLFKDHVPDTDSLVVEREKASGAIVLGKTNVPEFGLGSQTFNPVFGPTRNPYDLSKTCGGSTGGGAVALACGMAPLVDGSDMGGSLRNPGNFCNVVGIRPSPGRVPNVRGELGWFTLSVSGPMARNVSDCALLLSVQAGFDARSPIAIDQTGAAFARALGTRNFKGVRVAMIKDMGLPWEEDVLNAVHAQRKVFESLGCTVEEAEPDFTDANECFLAWRHWSEELGVGSLVDAHPDQTNEYCHWHVQEGRKLTGPYLARIEEKRSQLYQRVEKFMETYEFLLLPVNQVLPFDVSTRYPTTIADVKMENYIAWMKSAYYISTVGNPAMSVPCAFSPSSLPIGIQIVGRHHAEWSVLELGYAFEQATGVGKRRPGIV